MSSSPQARKAVLEMGTYSPPLEGRRGRTRLDFNENTVGFPDQFPHLKADFLTTYPEYQDAVEELAATFDLPKEQVLLVNGSDEGLFVACFTYIEPNQDKALVSCPTFALIPHYLQLCQAEIVQVMVKEDLKPDLEQMERELEKGLKLAALATPDNPTSQVIPTPVLEDWFRRFPSTMFLIDEAYQAYHSETVLPLVESYPNLIVSRTFSKAWGLAGLRLGFLASQPQNIEWMSRVRSPYSVNSMAVDALRKMLPRRDQVAVQAAQLAERKGRVIEEIRNRGYRVTAGHANFFLIWMGPTAPYFVKHCREKGILLRDRSHLPAMTGSVRVSTGSDEEMKSFLEALDSFHQEVGLVFDLDDTLVDTSESFDEVVARLVEAHSGEPLERKELMSLRAEGGYNDDWVATTELLRRRGVETTYQEIAEQALPLYLQVAPETERLLVQETLLETLAKRHRLFILTGRKRGEYEPVWSQRLGPFFTEVVCLDDEPQCPPKPDPKSLQELKKRHGYEHSFYVGNSVDDMRAADGAGACPIGVGTNQSVSTLKEVGGEILLEHPRELEKLWLIDKPE